MTKARIVLVLAAAMCVFAATVSAASAAKFSSTVTKDTVGGKGGEQVFTVGTATVKCTSVSGKSAATTFPTEQLKSTANYGGCEVVGLGKATVVCAEFDFHSTGTVKGGVDTEGTVTNGECKVEVVGGICKIVVPSQLAKGVTYTNSAGSVVIKATVSELKFTASAGCIGFPSTGKNAGYKGELTAKGTGNLSVV